MTADSEAGMGAASGPWSARVYHLGEEPIENLSAITTAEQRLAMVGELTARMWALTGRPLPSYDRREMPVAVVRGR